MKIYSNPELIKRNQTLGFWSTILGPILLIIGASFGITDGRLPFSLILLILGFIFYQIGQALKRYGQGADEDFNLALKSLNNTYAICHFTAPVAHLLVGPAGIWILIPRYGKGTVTYDADRKRWRSQANGFARIFGNNLGRPDLELMNEADRLDRTLQDHWQLEEPPHIEAAIVLMSNDVELDAKDAPIPTVHISKLRGLIKKHENKDKVSPEVITAFAALFEPEE